VQRPLAGRYIADSNTIALSRTAVRNWCVANRVSFALWRAAAENEGTEASHLNISRGRFDLTRGISGETPIRVPALVYILHEALD
jgi:hypothetical protein